MYCGNYDLLLWAIFFLWFTQWLIKGWNNLYLWKLRAITICLISIGLQPIIIFCYNIIFYNYIILSITNRDLFFIEEVSYHDLYSHWHKAEKIYPIAICVDELCLCERYVLSQFTQWLIHKRWKRKKINKSTRSLDLVKYLNNTNSHI